MGGILRRLFPGWRAGLPRPEGYQSWAEIEAMYPNQWVLLGDPAADPKTLEVFGGRVRAHAASRTEFDQILDTLTPEPVEAILYTGRPPPGTIFALNI